MLRRRWLSCPILGCPTLIIATCLLRSPSQGALRPRLKRANFRSSRTWMSQADSSESMHGRPHTSHYADINITQPKIAWVSLRQPDSRPAIFIMASNTRGSMHKTRGIRGILIVTSAASRHLRGREMGSSAHGCKLSLFWRHSYEVSVLVPHTKTPQSCITDPSLSVLSPHPSLANDSHCFHAFPKFPQSAKRQSDTKSFRMRTKPSAGTSRRASARK